MKHTHDSHESSAIVSLQELMRIEEQRLHQEEMERVAQAEAVRLAKEAADERRRAEEEQRLAQERESRAEEARKEREQAARMEAMRQALIEQERIKAERQAQQAEEALRLNHEREQAKILQQSEAKKLRRMLVGVSLGAATLIAGGLGLYFGKIKPDAEAQQARIQQETEAAQAALDAARRTNTSNQEELTRLQKELNEARTPQENATVREKIEQLPRQPNRPIVAPPTKTTTTTGTKPPCPVGDPLCY